MAAWKDNTVTVTIASASTATDPRATENVTDRDERATCSQTSDILEIRKRLRTWAILHFMQPRWLELFICKKIHSSQASFATQMHPQLRRSSCLLLAIMAWINASLSILKCTLFTFNPFLLFSSCCLTFNWLWKVVKMAIANPIMHKVMKFKNNHSEKEESEIAVNRMLIRILFLCAFIQIIKTVVFLFTFVFLSFFLLSSNRFMTKM